MTESEFWDKLEYRVCKEIYGLKDASMRRFWCDGFIPEQYDIGGTEPRILGRVWMGIGPRDQQKWTFILRLPHSITTRADIDWPALLPPLDATRWLTLDPVAGRLGIEYLDRMRYGLSV